MTSEMKPEKALVLGAGNFGTCLAQHLAREHYLVDLWARSSELVESINRTHKNCKYLTEITLSSHIRAINSLTGNEKYDVVVIAVPMQALRQTLRNFAQIFGSTPLIVSTVKGIEIESLSFPLQVIRDVLGTGTADKTAVLSGPSFAIEVAQGLPTAVVAASTKPEPAQHTQQLFHSANFRVYTSDDPIGLETAGALKNVIAIAAGASQGLGLQMNSSAALMTRGLAELTRVGIALGAKPLTFQGLGGVGDLFLTCSSPKSRNFSLGYLIGQGKSVQEALASLGSVAEGYYSTIAAKNLAATLKVDAPITEQVAKVLFERKGIRQALEDLVTRDAKPEFTSIITKARH